MTTALMCKVEQNQPQPCGRRESKSPNGAPVRPTAEFDYESLSEPVRRHLQERAAAILGLLGSRRVMHTAADVVEVGLRLQVVRDDVGRRLFQGWLKAEFQWKQPSASKFMCSAKFFQDVECLDGFEPGALYVLSRKKVPASARAEAIAAALAGEFIGKKEAEAIADRHTGRTATTVELVQACEAVEQALNKCDPRCDGRARAAIRCLARRLAGRFPKVVQEALGVSSVEGIVFSPSIDPNGTNISQEYFPVPTPFASVL